MWIDGHAVVRLSNVEMTFCRQSDSSDTSVTTGGMSPTHGNQANANVSLL